MKDDISLDELQIGYFFELEGDLLLTLHSNIIQCTINIHNNQYWMALFAKILYIVLILCLSFSRKTRPRNPNLIAEHISQHKNRRFLFKDQFQNATVLHTSSRFQIVTKNKTIFTLNVPEVFQATDYTCGPASLTAVMNYYGDPQRESDLAKLAKTSQDLGTDPYEIYNTAIKLGFTAQLKENMTVKELQQWLVKDVPIIVLIQAWKDDDDPTPYPSDFEDGHYVVAIGYDFDNIYFQDPWIIGNLGYISKADLPGRWHGNTVYPVGRHIYGCGIIIQKQKVKIPTVIQLQ